MSVANDYVEALRPLEGVSLTAIAVRSGEPAVAAAPKSHCRTLLGIKGFCQVKFLQGGQERRSLTDQAARRETSLQV